MSTLCPVCNIKTIESIGNVGSSILIARGEPSTDDIKYNKLFYDLEEKILRGELSRVGIVLDSCRLTTLWNHKAPKKPTDEQFSWHLSQFMGELEQAKYLLFMGNILSNAFVGSNISHVEGLELDIPILGRTASFASLPDNKMKGNIGEFRLAIEKFGERIRYNG